MGVMTEDSFDHLSLDDLYTLMLKTIDEYLVMHRHPGITDGIVDKRTELALIQKVIYKKKNKPA